MKLIKKKSSAKIYLGQAACEPWQILAENFSLFLKGSSNNWFGRQ